MKSLEHCELNQWSEMGCDNIDNATSVCYITENGVGGSYGKHCIAKNLCNKKSLCGDKKDCRIYCCDEHDCNRSKYSAASTVRERSFWFVYVVALLAVLGVHMLQGQLL